MKPFDKIVLNQNSSIKEALKIIDDGNMRIALVIDSMGKLIGTVSDGDIRRALLKNASINDPVENYIHTNFIYAKTGDSKEKIIKLAKYNKVYQIPIVTSEFILVGIEEINDLIVSDERHNTVVLMVGGLGSRLRPLTDDIPKPLLKVGDKPILETIIDNFSKHGFRNFILSVNYKSEMIEDYFGDGNRFGVNIEYVHENKRMGTAGALSLMKDKLNDNFFVMNGDLLTNINYDHLLDFHQKTSADATMCVREYDIQIPYGVVNTKNDNIVSIDEKPLHKFFVNAGIYMLNPNILKFIPKNTFYDMPTLFQDLIKQEKKILSFPIKEYWLDIGEIDEYKKANIEYMSIFGRE